MQCLRGSSLLWKSNIRTSATFTTKSIFWTTTFIICFIFILKTRDTILRWFCGGCSSLSYRLISGHFLIHIIILKNRVKFQIFVDIVKIYSSFCIYICQFRFTLNSKCSPFLPWQNSTSSSKAAEPARPYINDGSSEAQKMSWFLLWNASHLFCNWGTDLLVAAWKPGKVEKRYYIQYLVQNICSCLKLLCSICALTTFSLQIKSIITVWWEMWVSQHMIWSMRDACLLYTMFSREFFKPLWWRIMTMKLYIKERSLDTCNDLRCF